MKIFSKCKKLGIVKNCVETNLWRKKEHFAKYVVICEVFLELQSLYNLVDFLKLSLLINASVPWVFYLMKWTWDLDMKQIDILLDTIDIIFFLKNCYGWLKRMTWSYPGREYYTEKNGYI